MLTTVLLIRHGQTDWNLAGRWQGHLDIPLNNAGEDQARRLARRLSSWPIHAIYSSDLRRAADTAVILAAERGLTVSTDPALRERNGGQFQGLTFEEMEAQFAEKSELVRQNGEAPPDGESLLDVARRMTAAFEAIIRRHQGETIAIISHGGALNVLIAYVLGFPLGQPAPISLRGNTGLSIIELSEHGRRLTLLNDVSHLEPS